MKKNILDRFQRLTQEDKDRIYEEIIANCELVADCWVYRNPSDDPQQYGMKYIQGRMRTVSRFMKCYTTGVSLNIKQDACHVDGCPYKACCNPLHLEWGTHEENCEQREAQAKLSRESNRLENPYWFPQPALGHEQHAVMV